MNKKAVADAYLGWLVSLNSSYRNRPLGAGCPLGCRLWESDSVHVYVPSQSQTLIIGQWAIIGERALTFHLQGILLYNSHLFRRKVVGPSYMYGAHTLKGDTATYGSGTIVAVIGSHGPIRRSISSHSASSLPQISQVCFSRDINGYNTVPLCSVLALFTYKNTEFQALITSQLEQISKICSYCYTSLLVLQLYRADFF
jgi:hypothetical protein